MLFLDENALVDDKYLCVDDSVVERFLDAYTSLLYRLGYRHCYVCSSSYCIKELLGRVIEGVEGIVYKDTLYPMYRSIAGFYMDSIRLYRIETRLLYKSGFYIEAIACFNTSSIPCNSLYIDSIPDTYGAFIHGLSSKYSIVLVDNSLATPLVDGDIIVSRLRAFIPRNDIVEVIVCSRNRIDYLLDYECSRAGPGRSVDTVYLESICRKRNQLLEKLFYKAACLGYKPVYPIPCSNVFVFRTGKHLDETSDLVYRVYSRYSGLYAVLTTGFENNEYVRDVERVFRDGV